MLGRKCTASECKGGGVARQFIDALSARERKGVEIKAWEEYR